MAIARIPRSLLLLSAVAFLGGCGIQGPQDEELAPPNLVNPDGFGESDPEGQTLDEVFDAAGNEFNVPADLLKAISYAETGWLMVEGHEEFEGQSAAYGLMALRGERLERGAELAGVTVEEAKTDKVANVRAGAALLSEYAENDSVARTDLGDWARSVARYSNIEDNVIAESNYVHNEVYGVLRTGMISEIMMIEAVDVTAKFALAADNNNPGPDYAVAKYRPSPNWSNRPSGTSGDPQMVIIHTCEGSYSGCWSWLTNSNSGVSAHYVVNNSGSEVSQLVKESRKAWHISAKYNCSRNSGKKCNLNNVSSNNFTVGIEHAGYASQSSWSSGLLTASSKLTCDITKDQGIPADKYHIVGHGQLQPWNRVDPGANWPWGQYINDVNTHCNSTPPPPDDPPPPPPPPGAFDVIVDSNNNANGANASCDVSSNWTPSNNVAGYHNTGYWWRSTGSSSDLASFKVYLDAPKKLKVQAWWPAASDRSPTAPWIIYNGQGQHLDTVYTNQSTNGGKWNTIGEYNFTAGWNVVGLSRWTTAGKVVVGDAVRFTE